MSVTYVVHSVPFDRCVFVSNINKGILTIRGLGSKECLVDMQ